PNQDGNQDLKNLQSDGFRPLLGNAVVSTTNAWSPYIDNIHMDEATRLAVIPVDRATPGVRGDVTRVDPEDTITAMLDFIHQKNQDMGCSDSLSVYQNYTTSHQKQSPETSTDGSNCWIPVVIFEMSISDEEFEALLLNIASHKNPPAIVGHPRASETKAYQLRVATEHGTPNTVFVLQWRRWHAAYLEHRIIVDPSVHNKVINVTIVEESIKSIPDYIKDSQYDEDLKFMRSLIDEATQNDPIEGYSEEMPNANYADDAATQHFRPCMGGECPIGNLFADGIRWGADADFAFVNSGGVRGSGWEAGPVHVSDLWESLPFSDKLCTGTMTGLSVFRLFNFSTSVATFQTEYTDLGDRLLQISGARVTYNSELEGSRLLNVEIRNKTTAQYEPIQRLQLYSFATDNWVCTGFDSFPALLGSELVIDGEQAGQVMDSESVHDLVGAFLNRLDDPYDTSIQGRLVNDTASTDILDWIQTEDGCASGYYVSAAQVSPAPKLCAHSRSRFCFL
ncbi:MAG: hypothetical protein SGILL_004629, partial [Bacillariaceae sp.]